MRLGDSVVAGFAGAGAVGTVTVAGRVPRTGGARNHLHLPRPPGDPLPMNLPRSSGVQLHPTSLPGGRLGPEAHAFVDWLADAGQSWWQMLPLGPPDEYGSPYKAASAFAAWSGLLAEPRAPVTRTEARDFRDRHAEWIEDWL